ncbi:RlpA-like lipoprotein (plasmid) [Burkholderia sp. THE68]|jgi:rare lipoprotein A|uniref:septal ring lytic transglycosylase RlpA family protein n=1 Tax=Burkholderia sp. THE68 TaxID=758782 RepID=UPI0013175158|nr:septal ring lytic transglycosylase RlpA family protein [Burkholderia sp. THE68]BBU32885.1 RlpA-like lipoprotein [Burkholderia sp. THE68]
MQDNGFIAHWGAAGIAAIAASGACATLTGCAGHSPAPSKEADAPAILTEGARVADSMQGHESNSLDAEPLDYHSARANVAPQIGWASYYSGKFQGRRTASGERYDMRALTAAHRTLPIGTRVRVSNLARTRSVIVRINDRGPFAKGRVIDLSFAAAVELGLQRAGSAQVILEPVSQTVAQAATPQAPERIMLRIAPHPRHSRKRAHRH